MNPRAEVSKEQEVRLQLRVKIIAFLKGS